MSPTRYWARNDFPNNAEMFPSYAYSWFCVVLKYQKLKWKTVKKSVYIKPIWIKLYSTWYLCVQCIVLCYALISHSIETTDRWSDLILSYINQHVNSLILTCMRRKQKSGLTNTLKLKVLKMFFKRSRRIIFFGSTKNHSVLILTFYNLKNLLSPRRSFLETERSFR